MASDSPTIEDEWHRVDHLQLQFGDTLLMPTFHSVHGAGERGYLFVGMVRDVGSERKYPLFCTLQTSGMRGPCVLGMDPTTFCRPEVSIYTNPPPTKLPDGMSLEKKYLTGTRGIERSGETEKATEFVNLCQLAVLDPPSGGFLARRWGPELSNDFLQVFKKELEHMVQKHKSLYMGICEFYCLRNGDSLPTKAARFKATVKYLMKNAPSRNSTKIVNSEQQCFSDDCSILQRVGTAVRRCPRWSWGNRAFEVAKAEYKERTGIMRPFDMRAYKLNEITLHEDCESLDQRLDLPWRPLEVPKSPKPAPLNLTCTQECSQLPSPAQVSRFKYRSLVY